MKKIEGNEKQVCTELHKWIYTVLSDEMPDVLVDRAISFEWCKSGQHLGECILRPDFPVAVVRISNMFDFSRDTVAHEILHALLPFNTKHGPLFKKAMAVINDALDLHVTIVASRELSQTCKKDFEPYKYAIVNKETGELLLRFKRYCKKIKACIYYEATDPTWNYTVIPYDVYLATKKETKTEKIACAINDSKSDSTKKKGGNTMDEQQKEEYVDLSNNMDEQKIKKEVEQFAMTHDDMRLPADWLKYIPCRWECYYRYKINDGTEIANVFLYHNGKKVH